MNATASDQRERLPQFRAEVRTARPASTAHPPAGREPPAPPADGLPMTPRFLTETWRGETRILFSIRAFYKWRRVVKSMPNRTLRPAGRPALRVACAAVRVGAAALLAEYCALVIPAVSGRFREAGTGGCGQRPTGAVRSVPRGSANRDRRRRRRAGARTGSRAAVAANSSFRSREDSRVPLATYSISSNPEKREVLPRRTYQNGSFLFDDRAHEPRRCRRLPAGPA